jgi:hypothetical protein
MRYGKGLESERKQRSFASRCASSRTNTAFKRSKPRPDELPRLPAPDARRRLPSRRVRLPRARCRPANALRRAADGAALLRGLQLLGLSSARYGAGFGEAVTLRRGVGAVVRLVPLMLRGTLGTVRHHLKRKRLPEFSGLKAIVRLALECTHETPVNGPTYSPECLGGAACGGSPVSMGADEAGRKAARLSDAWNWCEVCGAIRMDREWVLPYTGRLAHNWAGERRGKWIRRAG